MGIFNKKKKVNENSGNALVYRTNGTKYSYFDEEAPERAKQFEQYKKAYDNVPLMTSIIDIQADQTVQEFFFEGKNSEKLQKFSEKTNLQLFFHRITKNMLIYGNAYSEIVKNGRGEIVDLKILNPIWIDVWRSPTGQITGYSQIINSEKKVLWGSTGKRDVDISFPKWLPKDVDSIAHFRYNVPGSEKYGRSLIAPLIRDLNIKLSMEGDLKHIMDKYASPLIWAKVGNDQFPANDDVASAVSSTLKNLQNESELTTSHVVDVQVLGFNDKGVNLEYPTEHTEAQIITGGHVPPVLLGRSKNVDKATAEVQLRSFGRHIKSIQRELKAEFEEQVLIKQKVGSREDKLIWVSSEEREREIEVDTLRGLVTDAILTPQKANDLLPPRFRETLPDPMEMQQPLLNGQSQGPQGQQTPRPNQMKNDKVKDNPTDPTQTTKNPKTKGKRVNKTDRGEKGE